MSLCNMRRCCRCYEIKPLCSNFDFQKDSQGRSHLWLLEEGGAADLDHRRGLGPQRLGLRGAGSVLLQGKTENNSSMKCHTSSPSGCLIVSAPRSRLRLPHLRCSRLKSETLINPPVRLSNFHTASQWSHNRPVWQAKRGFREMK